MWFLVRLRQNRNPINSKKLPVERDLLLGPGLDHDLQNLTKAFAVFLLRDTIAGKFDGAIAASNANPQPSFAQQVNERNLFC